MARKTRKNVAPAPPAPPVQDEPRKYSDLVDRYLRKLELAVEAVEAMHRTFLEFTQEGWVRAPFDFVEWHGGPAAERDGRAYQFAKVCRSLLDDRPDFAHIDARFLMLRVLAREDLIDLARGGGFTSDPVKRGFGEARKEGAKEAVTEFLRDIDHYEPGFYEDDLAATREALWGRYYDLTTRLTGGVKAGPVNDPNRPE